ncbi:hypothetical protein XELAEV_18024731mg [Xenopus laevis]|uniref:Helix-turn-helix domain-containing protein n=1 Tax=Xenopus laevis TaxID=8355 RepID=A0A974HL79_XENLA|nr:hypothetical protein XELAEV_18024731mg [Xenopus laevis]
MVDQTFQAGIIDQHTYLVLQPLVPQLDSFVLDTSHLLREINGLTLDPDCLEAIRSIFERIQTPISEQHSFILQALDLLLHHNVFLFDGIHYLQRQGMVMGANSKLGFLGIEIKKDHQGLVPTNLYQKKTGSNSLLHAKSMHPFKCIEGIPKGQYIRLRRICSSDEDFKHEAYKLYQRIKMRGYKYQSLHRVYQWALSQNREDLLYKSTNLKSGRIGTKNQGKTRLILIYNDNDGDIRTMIHKQWEIISKDPTLRKTKRPLKRRIYEHLLDIRNCNLLSSIAKHVHCVHRGIYAGSYFQGID